MTCGAQALRGCRRRRARDRTRAAPAHRPCPRRDGGEQAKNLLPHGKLSGLMAGGRGAGGPPWPAAWGPLLRGKNGSAMRARPTRRCGDIARPN